jgi:acyl-CoA reductase-like NAD-dependent aldehyde dehydrogenase
VSQLITSASYRVVAWIEEARPAALAWRPAAVNDDGLLAPTLLTDVTPDMKVCAKEVFGPVVAVQTYDSLDEALKLANDTDYGLQAAIFTQNLTTAIKAFRTLDFGGVLVNEVPTWRADQMPYGGVRDSGNTREGPAYAVREMTETRLVVINP